MWTFCAQNDKSSATCPGPSRLFGRSGWRGETPFTQNTSPADHQPPDSCLMALSTPAMVDWLLAQRRGVAPTHEPLLAITNPTPQAVLFTGATNLNLAGSRGALGQAVTKVAWTNLANNASGVATGTDLWNVTNIPLIANKTNFSWWSAPPPVGHRPLAATPLSTTRSPSSKSPLRAGLALQGTEALLNWSGGGPPYGSPNGHRPGQSGFSNHRGSYDQYHLVRDHPPTWQPSIASRASKVRKNKQALNPRCASPEKRKDIMNIKHFRSIVVSVCLGWLAPWLALAQPVITTQPTNHFMNAPGSCLFFC